MANAARENANGEYRKRRVKRIKKIIVTTVVILILLPSILSIYLMIKMFSMQEQIDQLVENRERQKQEEMVALAKPKATEVPQEEKEIVKKVFLTFEDGPSVNTEKILDILKKEKVKATFFVTGKEDEYSAQIYKRIVREGHTLAMHSYSHNVNEIYNSRRKFQEDVEQLSELLHGITGTFPTIYRFPGGSSTMATGKADMESLMNVLEEKGITFYDWNVVSPDVTNPNERKQEVVSQIMKDVEAFEASIVLMNDAVNHPMTVKALPSLLQNMKENDYELLPMDEKTPVIQHNTKRQEEIQ